MWSFGVITYILLGGYPPFQNDNKLKLLQQIVRAQYEFHPDCWSEVSQEAKDFISGMLTLDPHRRLTVDGALAHPWMQTQDEQLAAHGLAANQAALRKYQNLKKLKAGVRTVMAVNFMKKLISPKSFIKAHTLEERYELGRLLGEGGFAKVYHAVSTIDGKVAAVKKMKKDGMSSDEISALHVEVDVMKRLNHKNIVKMFDYFDELEYYSIVLEYVDGGELFDRIVAKTYYSEREARDAVLEFLDGVEYLHSKNIIHR
jgi:serine/threonine protein kinase